ncbi:Ketoacyl-synt-domain-containing protein [Favolaschia claudopus]|uniref:Ketoacyl-synt-domain-containing protein n=1 Tax=Favolaschia claudopus TaxID=2862362 RepID=A0AAW0CVM0_9AGAR
MESDGIAIVGIALQLPSGSSSIKDLDYDSFWDFLVEGKNAYQPLSDILPNYAQTHPTLKFPERGTFLKDATGFDNIALGISTKDARVIPYSGRRLLDLSFQALLDAGIDSRGQNIGCFMSGNRPLPVESPIDPDGSVSSWMPHSIANRISYALDLTGPSVYLDTACSSSLTGLHLAVGAIERGDCIAALVGAAQINREFVILGSHLLLNAEREFPSPYEWASYMQAGGILSSDGVCRPFDATASGFGRGEGVVVIVLKSFKAAILERDHIYGVIRGSAINTTGSQMPPNVPNSVAQQRALQTRCLPRTYCVVLAVKIFEFYTLTMPVSRSVWRVYRAAKSTAEIYFYRSKSTYYRGKDPDLYLKSARFEHTESEVALQTKSFRFRENGQE